MFPQIKLLTFIMLTIWNCANPPRSPLDSSRPLGIFYQLLPFFIPNIKPASTKEMKTYFISKTGSSAIITGTKMSLIIPYSASMDSLIAEFFHTGVSGKINGMEQVSGQTPNNYNASLSYLITAANTTQKTYILNTTRGNSDSNTLLGFQLDSLAVRGIITGSSVTLNVPYATNVKKLISTFSHNGSKVYVDGLEQISGRTVNDFSNPVLYEIEAENGNRKQYTVLVVSGTLSSSSIQSISADGIEGSIVGENIYFNFTPGQDISSIAPIISHLGNSVTVNEQSFINGETILDFTQPLKIKITSADEAIKEYTVYSGYMIGNTTTATGSSTYSIGGNVTGLSGTVILQNNGGDNQMISANEAFTFSLSVANLYSVTVLTQPTGQTCAIANGTGNASANVTNVVVNCATSTYTIGGVVTGLSGTVILQNNGGDNKSLVSNGSFTFNTSISYNGNYNVTILTNPVNQYCTVSNGTGPPVTGNVTNIIVDCNNNPGTTVQSFTDNGDGTIKDNNTGLVWMKCSMSELPGTPLDYTTNCSYVADDTGLQSTNEIGKYKFCREGDNDCNGGSLSGAYGNLIISGYTGSYAGSLGTIFDTETAGADHYIAYKACVEANTTPAGGFAGKTNWRVPLRPELETLFDNNLETTPKINTTYFPNTPDIITPGYWSASVLTATNSFYSEFNRGTTGSNGKGNKHYVRCVSSP